MRSPPLLNARQVAFCPELGSLVTSLPPHTEGRPEDQTVGDTAPASKSAGRSAQGLFHHRQRRMDGSGAAPKAPAKPVPVIDESTQAASLPGQPTVAEFQAGFTSKTKFERKYLTALTIGKDQQPPFELQEQGRAWASLHRHLCQISAGVVTTMGEGAVRSRAYGDQSITIYMVLLHERFIRSMPNPHQFKFPITKQVALAYTRAAFRHPLHGANEVDAAGMAAANKLDGSKYKSQLNRLQAFGQSMPLLAFLYRDWGQKRVGEQKQNQYFNALITIAQTYVAAKYTGNSPYEPSSAIPQLVRDAIVEGKFQRKKAIQITQRSMPSYGAEGRYSTVLLSLQRVLDSWGSVQSYLPGIRLFQERDHGHKRNATTAFGLEMAQCNLENAAPYFEPAPVELDDTGIADLPRIEAPGELPNFD
jgi:hypothetical protein